MVVYFLSTCGPRIKWMAGNSLHQSSFILLTMPSMSTFIQLQSPFPTPTYKAESNCRITGYFWDLRLVTPFNTIKLTSEGALRNQTDSLGGLRVSKLSYKCAFGPASSEQFDLWPPSPHTLPSLSSGAKDQLS